MDGQSWMCMGKSSNNSSVETESSGSLSSRSGRYSDEQDAPRASLNDSSPKIVPDILSSTSDNDAHDVIQSLSEKLSAALSELTAKECLVKQHAKVAEEAVSGWEKAEIEVATLKQQKEAAAQKNYILNQNTIHLDEALKECVKKLRQCREEQEQIYDALNSKSLELESCKAAFEDKLVELETQLGSSKSEASASVEDTQYSQLRALEEENSNLTMELHARSKDIEMLTLERDFCIRSAEASSKQNLESIKKVSRLEAECRKLRNAARNFSSSPCSRKTPPSSVDIQSGLDEPLLVFHGRPDCSDSWASALITELDQFKNGKTSARNIAASVELDMMDDFLEMERLVALPNIEYSHSTIIDIPPMVKVDTEREELEAALEHTKARLERTSDSLTVAESTLVDLERKLDSANESRNNTTMELDVVESRWKDSDSQLAAALLEISALNEKCSLIEGKLEDERAISAAFSSRAGTLESAKTALETLLELAHTDVKMLNEKLRIIEAKFENENSISTEYEAKIEVAGKKDDVEELSIKQEKELSAGADKLADCQKTIALICGQLKSLTNSDEFMSDASKSECDTISSDVIESAILVQHVGYSSENCACADSR